MEAMAVLEKQQQFDFQNNGIEVMNFETLQRTYIIGQTKCALFTNEMCKKKIFFHAKLKAFNQCLNSV